MHNVREKRPSEQMALTGDCWTRLAQIVSSVTNPLYIALPTFLLVALATAPSVERALLWWLVTSLGITLAPLLFIWRGVRLGHYSDHHVSVREQRFVPLLFGVLCMGTVFVLLLVLGASRALLATVTGGLVAGAIATIITRRWKISLHLVGMAGAVTTFGLVLGALYFCLAPLVVLVAWARWKVYAHTIAQACAGTVLAVVVALIIFWLFGVYK
ncbi:hypothetical protein KSD_67060 [Ktedonobacter sp. SOSP1-85]|uniref:hypothetical protein n=1 Tax=Ktedonobacter sp. SOSP1-85 TaxID=2778367 RepID=UPI00191554B9|nr:hypothetical protein [Ktedonobacter sp. SOSP1-85]GHO78935.1 hypothetical protein KSD_67060 [Ktedonobacter sp. SOSP1-85]